MRFKINAETFSHSWELPARLTGEGGTPSGHGIPADARYKPGSGGQLIAFVPSLDLVVTRQTGSSGAWEYAEYLRRACAAVLPETNEDQSRARPESYPKWSMIELAFAGPDSKARGEPNPFAVRLDVTFSNPSGKRYRVPVFYDGDGGGGEDNDVWPWLGDSAKEAKANSGHTARFDIGKLERWREVFEHMQTRGIVPYLILEDDSAWKGYNHDRYHRERVWEAHVLGPYDQPYSAWGTTWKELGGARAFMESIPFHEMQPRTDLIKAGDAFCLAKFGDAYALYLPQGGSVSVELATGRYTCAWWNPSNGNDGKFQSEQDITGGGQTLTAPAAGDWAVRILSAPP